MAAPTLPQLCTFTPNPRQFVHALSWCRANRNLCGRLQLRTGLVTVSLTWRAVTATAAEWLPSDTASVSYTSQDSSWTHPVSSGWRCRTLEACEVRVCGAQQESSDTKIKTLTAMAGVPLCPVG